MNQQENHPSGSGQQPERHKQWTNRRTILWIACGAYLIYLAYGLLQGYVSGEAAESNAEVISLVGGVIFALAGVALVVLGARMGFLAMRENAQEMARVEEEDRQAEEQQRLREAEADEDDDDVTEADGGNRTE